MAAISVCGQTLLSPTAEFDLSGGHGLRHHSRSVRYYFGASPNGLTLIRIGENSVFVTSADLNGRILHSDANLASVHAGIYKALLRQDGEFWLVSSGPCNLSDGCGQVAGEGAPCTQGSYNELDLYSRAGEHLESLRLLCPVGGSESPIAALNEEVVLLSGSRAVYTPRQSQFVHFGTVTGGQFKERTRVTLAPPIFGAIPILAANGALLLINKRSGTMEVVDPATKSGSLARVNDVHPVQAAAADADYLYLLSTDRVLKMDIAGQVASTYRFQVSRGFRPGFGRGDGELALSFG